MGKKTLKLKGAVNSRGVVALIDCGATHNFIATDLVEELQLPMQEVRRYSMMVGDGRRTYSNRKCPSVRLEIQGMTIEQPFYPFSLGNVDVVLGVE